MYWRRKNRILIHASADAINVKRTEKAHAGQAKLSNGQTAILLEAAILEKSNLKKSNPEVVHRRGYNGLPVSEGELWTSRQRQMHPLHYTVSYRASFKPELPDFFMRRYCRKSASVVLDPFGGRGTTILQANLLGHSGIYNDANPVSKFIAESRRVIPPVAELVERVRMLDLNSSDPKLSAVERKKMSPFFHRDTLREIVNLKKFVILGREQNDPHMNYIGVTALSRLYGHSDGFFSVYTFPQISILPQAQARNNIRRNQTPVYKNVSDRIIRKMQRDLSKPVPSIYHKRAVGNRFYLGDARKMTGIKKSSVDLIVTSPPFLNKVNYLEDNWMRAWFLSMEDDITPSSVTITADLKEWATFMRDAMLEFGRTLRRGGRAVIEVGEVSHGGRTVNLEELLLQSLPLQVPGGNLRAEKIYINRQSFTKLANCWSVSNNRLGTNSNRCLVLLKE